MRIAAFNAKNLGQKKVTDRTVVQYLTKIISRYSVVVILEVVDKSGKAMEKLLKEINTATSNRNHPYSKIASCQLGRDTYKEQFVCFYRKDEVTLETCYQYEDNQVGDLDVFAREPFVLRFSCPATVIRDLVLIPVHTKPEDSEKELDELYDVVAAVRKKWRTDNIMILGDFNADGRYLSKKKKKNIRICSAEYHWLIDDDVDTTSSNCNDHTYDRIVVYGQNMLNAIVPGSAKSFNFQEEFELTDEQAVSISDHYPVEVELETNQKAERKRKRPPSAKTMSSKGQAQTKGPQKRRSAKPTELQKKSQRAKLTGPQKKRRAEPTETQKKSQRAKPTGPQKKRRRAEPTEPQKKRRAEPTEPQKKRSAEPTGPQKKKRAEPTEPQRKRRRTKPTGPKGKRGQSSAAPGKK